LSPGDQISRYRIVGPLGRGGMGVVYRAEDTRLNREVALKFLPGDRITENDKQRFINEARTAAAARHPNICPIYDIDEEGGRLFIAMALIEGQTIQHKVMAGQMPIPQIVSIALQIASGLECAHSLGIVHRDIKSGNIMVDPAGHVSILDFGLALRPDTTRLTVEGGTLGSPSYMSPEQAKGLALDGRTDIWSLGVVLFEMVTGVLPFRRDHAVAVVHAILTDPVLDIALLRPDAPRDLIALIEKALAKKPEDRWQTAGEFSAGLKCIGPAAHSGSYDATRTMAIETAHASRQRRRFRAWWIAAGVAAAGLVGYFGFNFLRHFPAATSVQPTDAALRKPGREIAMLPFQVPGNDENARTISDGLVDALTSALSDVENSPNRHADIVTVPASEIRSRHISTVEEARRIYGVNYAITATATIGAGGLEFALQLVDGATSQQTGATERFVYDPADPIASRDRAVAAVMKLLGLDEPKPAAAAVAGDTATPKAYSSYLRARGLLARYDVAGNVDKALALLQGAVKADPNYALAWAGLAEAELQKVRDTGDKKWSVAAIADAQRSVHIDGSLATAHSVLGQVYASAGREEEAIAELKRALEIAPNNAEVPRELARVYNNLGRFKEAEQSYLKATGARPTDWYAHFLLAIFYYQRERYADSEAELLKARDLTPDNDVVYRNLGAILSMQGRYREATEHLQHALRIKTDARSYAALGAAYYYEHKFQDAVGAAEAAIELDSGSYPFWGNAGIYYKWAKGSEQKSAPSLRQAVDLAQKNLEATPRNYDIMANLAEYWARLGDSGRALAELDKIPASARKPLSSRFAIVYELTGRRREALELIRANFSTGASLNQIRDDPDLAALWNSPEMKQIAAGVKR